MHTVRLDMSNITFSDEYFWQMDVAQALWVYIAPVIITVGVLFNGLIILVLLMRKFCKDSTRILLITLALADITVLLVGPLRHWLLECFGIEVRLLSYASCPIHSFLIYQSQLFSSMTLVLLTLENEFLLHFHLKLALSVHLRIYADFF